MLVKMETYYVNNLYVIVPDVYGSLYRTNQIGKRGNKHLEQFFKAMRKLFANYILKKRTYCQPTKHR